MKNSKLLRNIWLIIGVCWLVTFKLNLELGRGNILLTLEGISCALSFIIAYINHKKIIKENKGVSKK